MDILQLDDNTYQGRARGCTYTITRQPSGWRVTVENAATRAWRSLGTRDFSTLEEVEAHYKSLKGLSALIQVPETGNTIAKM